MVKVETHYYIIRNIIDLRVKSFELDPKIISLEIDILKLKKQKEIVEQTEKLKEELE